MEIQDFVENTYMGNFKEWDGKIIWKGKETLVRLTIYKECDNVELEKEKMFKIFEKLYFNQDEWDKKVKDTMIKYFYDVLNDDFFDDGAFPEYPTCYDMLFKVLKDDFTKEAFKKLLDNEDMEIIIDLTDDDENSFSITMYERLFFVDKMFYAECNFNGEIDEFYMD